MRERAFPAKRLLGRAVDGALMACGAAAGCLMLALAYSQLSAPVGNVHDVVEPGGSVVAAAPGAKLVHPRRRPDDAHPAAIAIGPAGGAPILVKLNKNAVTGAAIAAPRMPLVPRMALALPSSVRGPARVVDAGTAARVAAAGLVVHVALDGLRGEAPRVVALRLPASSLPGRAPPRPVRTAAAIQLMPEPPIGFSVHPSLAVVPEAQDPGPAPPVASTVTLRIEKRRR